MKYTYNSNLTHYIDCQEDTNCGSYALRINEWYDLDEDFETEYGDIDTWIEELYTNGYSDEEISNMYAYTLVDFILQDFDSTLFLIKDAQPPYILGENEELIAFATFCYYDDEDYYSNWDYHFKVYRNGQWKEKCGCDPIRSCDISDWGRYISDVFYFIHKI